MTDGAYGFEGENPRPKQILRHWKVAISVVLILTSVLLIATYRDYLYPGPTWDTSKFGRPVTLDDGSTGVFTYSRSVYRLQHQGGLIFGGSTAFYFIDVKFIGTYDFRTKDTRVVYREQHKRGGDGGGNFVLQDTAGQMVLVFQEPTRQADYALPGRWLLFNLKDSSMTVLPLERELKVQKLGLGWHWLMKGDGTLMVVTKPLNPDGSPPFRMDPPYEVLVRLPDGEYLQVATANNYLGFRDNDVGYTVSKPLVGTVALAYSIVTRTARELTRSEENEFSGSFSKEHPIALGVSRDKKHLEIDSADGGAGSRTPINIDERLLR